MPEFIARNGLIAQNNSTISGSLNVTSGITGSLLGTASFATTASYLTGYISPFPYTGSAVISGSLTVTGSLNTLGSVTSTGTLTAQTLVVQTITSSVLYSSGSNIFGNSLSNTQALTGSVGITGSLNVAGTTSTQLKYFLKESNTNAWSIYTDGANGPFYIKDEYNSGSRLTIGITGNVGIGTTSPRTRLQVTPASNGEVPVLGTATGMTTFTSANGNYGIQFNSTSDGSFHIQSQRFDAIATAYSLILNYAGGNVGIGTASPATKLTVSGADDGTMQIRMLGTAAPTYYWEMGREAMTTGDFRINESYAGTVTNKLTIKTSSGNVGIGTTSPAAKLDILGANEVMNIAGTNATSAYTGYYYNTSTLVGYIGNGTSILSGAASSDFIFRSQGALVYAAGGNNERMRITSSGSVGIGTTPNLRLTVYDSGATITSGTVTFATQAKGIEIYNAISGTTDNLVGCWFSTGPHKAGIASGRSNAASNWAVDLRFFVHGTEIANLDQTYEKMRLSSEGTLTCTGDVIAYGSPSDLRLKIIKEKVPNALASVLKLNGYRFDWKETNHLKNYKEDIGVIAQEVAELFPELARTNADGNMSVRYQGLTAVLIEAIKEQQTQIEELKTIINGFTK
jgi:hypothetical protein